MVGIRCGSVRCQALHQRPAEAGQRGATPRGRARPFRIRGARHGPRAGARAARRVSRRARPCARTGFRGRGQPGQTSLAEALILDSEAVHSLARATERGALAERARAILAVAFERRALVRVPAAVLAEVCRGPRFDAAVDHLLTDRGIAVCDLTRSMAQRAGALLSRAKLSSRHAVDAFVVATALEFDAAVIATGDPGDVRRLAAPYRQLRVFPI